MVGLNLEPESWEEDAAGAVVADLEEVLAAEEEAEEGREASLQRWGVGGREKAATVFQALQ